MSLKVKEKANTAKVNKDKDNIHRDNRGKGNTARQAEHSTMPRATPRVGGLVLLVPIVSPLLEIGPVKFDILTCIVPAITF